jgi:catechol 2,3-dioxygenase-like lactoylglutathione lyase family enzyme
MATINRINHMLLITRDMNKCADFFVNILGFKVKGTAQRTMNVYPESTSARPGDAVNIQRLYFFQLHDSSMIVCAEVPDADPAALSPVLPNFWPGDLPEILGPRAIAHKVDHLALNVDSRDDLVEFQQRLRSFGIEVSEIHERKTSPKFVKSIYFYSPDKLPMEICTWDKSDPDWLTAEGENYMRDPNPVPALKGKLGA